MRGRALLIWIWGIFTVLIWCLPADSLETIQPSSTLPAYVPTAQPNLSLSSLAPHCHGCTVLVPDKPKGRTGGKGFHRPPRRQGMSYKRVKNGSHLKFQATGSRSRPVQLPHRSLTRLGLMAQHFESWQVQAVDGDTIRYGGERIRLRGLNAPELSEPGGFEARQRLAELLSRGNIRIIPHGQDIYGRMLADVFISDRNVAEIMTSEGFARRG